MKLSQAASLLLFLGVVSAAPSSLEARLSPDPDLVPITLSKAETQLLLQRHRLTEFYESVGAWAEPIRFFPVW